MLRGAIPWPIRPFACQQYRVKKYIKKPPFTICFMLDRLSERWTSLLPAPLVEHSQPPSDASETYATAEYHAADPRCCC